MLNKGDLEFFKGQIESIEKEQKEITEDIRDSYIEANKSVKGFLVDKYKEDLLDLVKGSKDKDEYFKKKREYELKNNIGPCEAYWIADWTTLFYSKDNGDIKMIEESSATFDDLIDVAMKAWKDGYLKVLEFERGAVEQIFTVIGEDALRWHDGDSDHSHAMDLINSLYTETFVIESEEDMSKFNNAIDSIILANGEDIIDIVMFNRNEPYFTNGGVSAVKVPFTVLKGATVTQNRG